MCLNCPPRPFQGLEWGRGDLPPGDFSARVSLRRCLRRHLSMWESFSLSMANSISRSTRSSYERVRVFLSDVPLQLSHVLVGIFPTSHRCGSVGP